MASLWCRWEGIAQIGKISSTNTRTLNSTLHPTPTPTPEELAQNVGSKNEQNKLQMLEYALRDTGETGAHWHKGQRADRADRVKSNTQFHWDQAKNGWAESFKQF